MSSSSDSDSDSDSDLESCYDEEEPWKVYVNSLLELDDFTKEQCFERCMNFSIIPDLKNEYLCDLTSLFRQKYGHICIYN